MKKAKSFIRASVIGACLLTLTSCSGMTDMQQRMVTGGATGAVVGTVGTVITGGCIPCGTVIGAAVGTAAGFIIDQMDKNTKPASSSGSQSGVQGSP
jgi:hypothetical protein